MYRYLINLIINRYVFTVARLLLRRFSSVFSMIETQTKKFQYQIEFTCRMQKTLIDVLNLERAFLFYRKLYTNSLFRIFC